MRYKLFSSKIISLRSRVRNLVFAVDDLASQIAAQLPLGSKTEGKFDPDDWMEPKESRKVDDFIVYAIVAADEALEDAGWKPQTYDDQIATGVLIGSGIGGLQGIEEASITLRDRGPRRSRWRRGRSPFSPAQAEPENRHCCG